MTETSQPWDGTVTGDATIAPYSGQEWQFMYYKLFSNARTAGGVIQGYENELETTGVATPIAVNTGAAIVDGVFYENDASKNVTVSTPAVNPRIDRLVLRKDPTAQTVRLTLIAGAEAASPVPPAMTQTPSGTWDVPLYQVYIDTGGQITLFDEFHYATAPLSRIGQINGRLTPSYGYPTYDAVHGDKTEEADAYSVSSTDQVAETLTFTNDPFWNTGQAVKFDATSNGVVVDTVYYIGFVSANVYSLHTTLVDAMNDDSRLNLTGSVTGEASSNAIYYQRYNGMFVDVYETTDEYSTRRIPENGWSLLLDGLTTDELYDIFLVDDVSGGTTWLEADVWASDTARTTDIEFIDGTWFEDGDQTKRYLGTIRVTSGNFVERITSDLDARHVFNAYNQIDQDLYTNPGYVNDNANTTYALNSATFININGGTDNTATFVNGLAQPAPVTYTYFATQAATSACGISLDGVSLVQVVGYTDTGGGETLSISFTEVVGIGFHTYSMVAQGTTVTIYADFARTGASADPPATLLTGIVKG